MVKYNAVNTEKRLHQ